MPLVEATAHIRSTRSALPLAIFALSCELSGRLSRNSVPSRFDS